MHQGSRAPGGIVIVGAGHAGGSAAALLRQYGYEGPITLIGAEPLPPYQRPPLSKAWIKGEVGADALLLRPQAFYPERDIALRLSTPVLRIDPSARAAVLDDGSVVSGDALVLATGARPRPLPVPGADRESVLVLRTLADAARVREALVPGRRIAVIGGGYVGLELAASARALGVEVVVIERETRLLARIASAELSQWFAGLHARHGVALLLGAEVVALESAADSGRVVNAVRLRDGRRIDCDVVVVGVGALADDSLASAAGIVCDDGIVVDDRCRTSAQQVYAIGDCTRRPVPRYDRVLRLESVPSALEQARQVAAHLCGKSAPLVEPPWFWSDQYDARLQIAGMPLDVARTVLRGDPASGRFSVFHLRADGVVQAVEAVNAPQDFLAGKSLVAGARAVDASALGDPAQSLKALML